MDDALSGARAGRRGRPATKSSSRSAIVRRLSSQYSVIGTPLDELHHEVGPARVGRAGVEDLRDVRVVHQRQRLALRSKRAMTSLRVHAELDDLERDLPADGLALLGQVDGAEAALAEFSNDCVAADDSARDARRRRNPPDFDLPLVSFWSQTLERALSQKRAERN